MDNSLLNDAFEEGIVLEAGIEVIEDSLALLPLLCLLLGLLLVDRLVRCCP